MIDISLKQMKKSYAADIVLRDVNLEVHSGEKIGLIGPNGSGKTTILKIIAGKTDCDEGSRFVHRDKKIGYLDQIPAFPESYTVTDVLNGAFAPVIEVKRKMRALEDTFEDRSENHGHADADRRMAAYGKLQVEFERQGGYEYETKLEKICTGLKLMPDFLRRYFRHLSSGEKSIVVLAKILLESCDVMLLDEPTNHLDIEAIEWLESYLGDFPGGAIIVSHDRYFLDKTVHHILELEGGRTEAYHGNYTYFVKERERRLFAQFEQYKNQEKKIKAMEAAIKRFREWGRRSDDPRMFRKAANMEKRIERMEKVDKPVLERRRIKLNAANSRRSGTDVVSLERLAKRFDGTALFEDLNGLIRYREHVAVLGRNGSGKSTLLKLMLGQLESDEGTVRMGSQVRVGYLEQEVSFPDPQRTIIDEIRHVLEVDAGKARAYLAKMLFLRDDAFKQIANLSGGELVRLKWCLLMHQDINFLVLDEPTNHLDIDSREVLEEYLSEFAGTILFVSHDRFFINKMADRVLHLADKRLTNYPGNYDDFKETRSRIDQRAGDERGAQKKQSDGALRQSRKSGLSRHTGKRSQYVKSGSKNRKRKLEADLDTLESAIAELESEMAKHPSDYQKQQDLHKEQSKLHRRLDELLEALIELEA